MTSLARIVLGPSGRQRSLVAQSLLGFTAYVLFAAIQHAEVLLGHIDLAESNIVSLIYVGGSAAFYLVLRSGFSQHFSGDHSLTMAQTAFAFVMVASGYAISGPTRGGSLTVLVFVMAFAMFTLNPRQARQLALLAFSLLAVVMLWKTRSDPQRYPPDVEIIHAAWTAVVLGGLSVLAGRMGTMRMKLTAQKQELQSALKQIGEMACRDELTGLLNRRHMTSLLREEQERQRGAAPKMTVAMLDIDFFKRINDQHGHRAGDTVLQRFAEAARVGMRSSDVLARWGGEEFLMMLPGTPPDHALKVVERLRECLSEVDFRDMAPQLHVTFSSGLAACDETDSLETCIERADQAMYRAKTDGRNRSVLA